MALLGIIGFMCGSLITGVLEFALRVNKKLKTRFYTNPKRIFGYHVHHSTFGLLLMLMGLTFLTSSKINIAAFLIGGGLGVIIMHTITDGRIIFFER